MPFWLDYGLTLLLGLLETAAFMAYASYGAERRYSIAATAALWVAFGILDSWLLFLFRSDSHSWVFSIASLIYLTMLFGSAYQVPWSKALYMGLIVLVVTRFVRHTFGNALLAWMGTIGFLFAESPWVRAACCLALFILFAVSLQLVARCMPTLPAGGVTPNRLLVVLLVTATLVYANDFVVQQLIPLLSWQQYYEFMGALSLFEAVCGVAGIAVIACIEILVERSEQEVELRTSKLLLREQTNLYKAQIQNQERIAICYHDLKKHLDVLERLNEAKGGDSAVRAYIGELTSGIHQLKKPCDTGSQALDLVVSRVLDDCEKNETDLQLLVDGRLLEDMRPVDITALFGNILDNAVEAVSQMRSEERVIDLRVSRSEGWLVVRCENPCLHISQVCDGKPVSTKDNNDLHGFGLESVHRIAVSYGGHLNWREENGRFILTVLLHL